MWTPKDPASVEFFSWDFGPALAAGDTLATLTGITPDQGDGAVTVSNAALSSNTVKATFASGTPGATYLLRATAVTTFGETLHVTGTLLIRRPIY
jgi:hypothetical protein